MSNFYGKRFLSALMGALSVLSSPVASAGKRRTRDDTLGSGKSSSRRRGKGDVKRARGGKIKSNRKVKSIGGLKKVLKETGGKVVGVSPDGKGGFVAFVKTPAGIVTVTIVGVALVVIISYLACFRRKNDYANASGEQKNDYANASEKLLERLFENDQGKYGSFVEKLFEGFFNDKSGILKGKFDNCGKNLDKFLKVVFGESTFGCAWGVEGVSPAYATVLWGLASALAGGFGGSGWIDFIGSVFKSAKSFVAFKKDGNASWGDKISAILFAFWCSVKFEWGLDEGESKVKEALGSKDSNDLKKVFGTISDYVGSLLESAGRDYDGQKKKLDDDGDGDE